MKTNGEIYDIVMDRKDEYEVKKRARNKRIGAISAAVLAVAVCVTAGVALRGDGIKTLTSRGRQNAAGYESGEIIPGGNVYGSAEQTAVSRAGDTSSADDPTEEYTGKEMQTTQTFVFETVGKVKMLNSTVLKSHILKN